jgi:nitrogen-specific signal transduction histidine kinase
VVTAYHGMITLLSAPGHSDFTVRLPLSHES